MKIWRNKKRKEYLINEQLTDVAKDKYIKSERN